MKNWLLALLMVISPAASATQLSDWKVLELREAYLEYGSYTWAIEPFLAPTYRPTQRFNVGLNIDLVNGIVFFDNVVHSETDQFQYRKVGWNYKFGVHLGDSVDVFFEHFSQHLLDVQPVMPQTYDMVGVRVWLYRKKDSK